jgi:hypothetical protein
VLKVTEVVLILLTPTLAGAALLGSLRLWRFLAGRRRLHRSPTGAVAVPLETLAAELRRLHRQLVRIEDAADMTPGRGLRVKAIRAAYGDSLLDACRALDVPNAPADPTRLTTSEIYRLEAALRDRGLDIRPTALH